MKKEKHRLGFYLVFLQLLRVSILEAQYFQEKSEYINKNGKKLKVNIISNRPYLAADDEKSEKKQVKQKINKPSFPSLAPLPKRVVTQKRAKVNIGLEARFVELQGRDIFTGGEAKLFTKYAPMIKANWTTFLERNVELYFGAKFGKWFFEGPQNLLLTKSSYSMGDLSTGLGYGRRLKVKAITGISHKLFLKRNSTTTIALERVPIQNFSVALETLMWKFNKTTIIGQLNGDYFFKKNTNEFEIKSGNGIKVSLGSETTLKKLKLKPGAFYHYEKQDTSRSGQKLNTFGLGFDLSWSF